MDRALKERIIGAIVLVLFVVLVVPVFLDGPTNDGEIISESVPLPGQSDEESRTVVLERDRTEPVPAATSNNSAPEPEPQPQSETTPIQAAPAQQITAPDPEPEPAPKREPEPVAATPTPEQNNLVASTTGMWAVQLGSFGSQANAEKLAADLRKQGFAAFLSQLSTGSGELHRVRIGPQKDRESAEAMAGRLQKAGHKGQVVPHP
ncbi:MAG: SPOR domain-containing protein [Woeseiaceae bacterium]